MRNRFLGLTAIVVGAVLLAFSPVLFAQTAPQRGAGKAIPDLSGIWDNTHLRVGVGGPGTGRSFIGPGDIPATAFTTEEPPMLPGAAEKYKAARTGITGPWAKGIDAVDPTLSCFPYGPTRMYTLPRPWEIRQFPEIVLLFYERDHGIRRVYMDGRGHPDGYPVTWMGHSIGKYDGDSLVVDTVGIHDQTWIDHLGHPHSEALRVVERFRRLDRETIQIDFTFDDPKTYTKPWTGKKIFKLAPPGFDILEDVICEDWLEMGKKR